MLFEPNFHAATLPAKALCTWARERGLITIIDGSVSADRVDVRYVLDQAEIPTVQERGLTREEVLRRMREEATREGRTLAQAFEDCRRFYGEAGFAAGWRDHHQGGMTGYASRELIATRRTQQEIREGQAFAWNPTVKWTTDQVMRFLIPEQGAKAEETFVLGPHGPEILNRP